MRPHLELNTGVIVVAVIAALALGISAVAALLGSGTSGPPTIANNARTSSPTVTVAPTSVPTSEPTAVTTPPLAVATSPTPAVELVLASVDRQPSQGGLTVIVDVINHQSSPLAFAFDPAFDLQLRDAAGKSWPLRWAEYKGVTSVPAAASAQLARAFFAGSLTASTTWPLAVSVRRVPRAPSVEWHVDKVGTATIASIAAEPPLPTLEASGPLGLTLSNPEPSSQLGGLQVDLDLQNRQTTDLVFLFDPNAQISATDNLGRPYLVRWAQYDGTIRIARGATGRLARVFFSGPIADGNPTWLKVTVRQVPGARPLSAVAGLG